MTQPKGNQKSFEPPFGVIGLGLVGGSLCKALRALFPRCDVIGVEPNPTVREQALHKGAVVRVTEYPTDLLSSCSIVFCCAPVGETPKIFTALASILTQANCVSDVVGVKLSVERWAAELLGSIPFVGGHPMVGGVEGGFAASRADLFQEAVVALCPSERVATADHLERLLSLWSALGALPTVMSSAEHDAIVAGTSHAPYVAALAHVDALRHQAGAERLMGRGLAYATRHALFEPGVMAAVVAENPHLPEALRALGSHLHDLAELLQNDRKGFLELAGELQAQRRAWKLPS